MPKAIYSNSLLEDLATNQYDSDTLDLSNQNLGAEQITQLVMALKTNKRIVTLILRNNSIGDEGARLLASLDSIKELDMSCTGLNNQGFIALFNSSTLQLSHLRVGGNLFDVGAFQDLKNHASLRLLDLSFNSKLDKHDLSPLIKALKQLEILNLKGIQVHGETISALVEITRLRALNLSSCTLQASSAQLVLTQLQLLERLDLSHNFLPRNTLPDLAQSSLKYLNLSANSLTDDDVTRLTKLAFLEELDLGKNPLLSIKAIDALACHKALRSLVLSRIPLNQETLNKYLTDSRLVSLTGDVSEYEALESLVTMLAKNRKSQNSSLNANNYLFFNSRKSIAFNTPTLAKESPALLDPYNFGLF